MKPKDKIELTIGMAARDAIVHTLRSNEAKLAHSESVLKNQQNLHLKHRAIDTKETIKALVFTIQIDKFILSAIETKLQTIGSKTEVSLTT